MSDADNWPVVADLEQYDETPCLACDGWIERKTITGTVVPDSCRTPLTGSTLAEIRMVLERHLELVPHVKSPYERK